MSPPTQCFVSYSHLDCDPFEKLLPHVQALANIYGFKVWHDRRLATGYHWHSSIITEIERSQIFVCLVTNHFFASAYIFDQELPAIRARKDHHNALVLPIVFEESCWRTGFGGYIEFAPKDKKNNLKPVSHWPKSGDALGTAANSFSTAIATWFAVPPRTAFPAPAGALP